MPALNAKAMFTCSKFGPRKDEESLEPTTTVRAVMRVWSQTGMYVFPCNYPAAVLTGPAGTSKRLRATATWLSGETQCSPCVERHAIDPRLGSSDQGAN